MTTPRDPDESPLPGGFSLTGDARRDASLDEATDRIVALPARVLGRLELIERAVEKMGERVDAGITDARVRDAIAKSQAKALETLATEAVASAARHAEQDGVNGRMLAALARLEANHAEVKADVSDARKSMTTEIDGVRQAITGWHRFGKWASDFTTRHQKTAATLAFLVLLGLHLFRK